MHSQTVENCDPSPCLNSAKCISTKTSYYCVCKSGFSGTNCEIQQDFCSTNTCLNGGQCIKIRTHFMCKCLIWFQGANCEIFQDFCKIKNPCANNGTCISCYNNPECQDTNQLYKCNCSENNTGVFCNGFKTKELCLIQCKSNNCLSYYDEYYCMQKYS